MGRDRQRNREVNVQALSNYPLAISPLVLPNSTNLADGSPSLSMSFARGMLARACAYQGYEFLTLRIPGVVLGRARRTRCKLQNAFPGVSAHLGPCLWKNKCSSCNRYWICLARCAMPILVCSAYGHCCHGTNHVVLMAFNGASHMQCS